MPGACSAHAVHMQHAHAVHMQCTCMQCTRSAHAVHMQHLQVALLPVVDGEGEVVEDGEATRHAPHEQEDAHAGEG